MNDITKALKMRGFFIVEEDDHLRFGSGSHPNDEKDLKQMLEKLDIPATFYDHKIIILSENFDDKKYQEIIWYPAENHEIGGNGGWRSWKYFIKGIYGPKVRTITLESGLALFVKSLSAAGITTISSCDGHGKKSPCISFLGHYNACWFRVLYKKLLNNFNLNYNWEIEHFAGADPYLIAQTRTGKWELQLVLEDTYRMACFLLQYGQQISEVKRELFGTNRNSTRKLVKDMSVEELTQWMEQKYLEKTFSKGGL